MKWNDRQNKQRGGRAGRRRAGPESAGRSHRCRTVRNELILTTSCLLILILLYIALLSSTGGG